jgi:hypothetical protein
MLILPRGARSEAPTAPPEIRDAVEMYARQHGRTGSIEFAVGPNVWIIKLSLRPNDERMRLWQEGRAPEPPTEMVWLQEPNPDEGKVLGTDPRTGRPVRGGMFRPLNIYEMGAEGVLGFLQRGNTWSGRGEFGSVEEAVRKVREDDVSRTEAFRAEQKEASRLQQRENRRRLLDIPMKAVGIDLKGKAGKGSRPNSNKAA